MAPPTLYRRPNEQLVSLLAEARREGLKFDEAWKRAVRPDLPLLLTNAPSAPEGAVLWPTDYNDRLTWRAAILAMKDEMRRAYERRPATRRERSVGVLVEMLSGAEGIPGRTAVQSAR